MNLLKKLFGKKEPEFTPDNTRLLQLIQRYHQEETNENYGLVIKELYGDSAFLLVPTANENKENSQQTEWNTLKAGATLSFTTVFNLEGLLVFGVFTSEEALSKWATEKTAYTAMPAKAVLEIAQKEQFGRIVIDSDQPTMFVLERDTSNITTEVLTEDTEVTIGTPLHPIAGANKESLIREFSRNTNIKEVYHFVMVRGNESVLILAILLEQQSDDARKAILGAINTGMNGYTLDLPLDIMYLDTEDSWYETAKQFEIFYKK